jgi:hypothetical protein
MTGMAMFPPNSAQADGDPLREPQYRLKRETFISPPPPPPCGPPKGHTVPATQDRVIVEARFVETDLCSGEKREVGRPTAIIVVGGAGSFLVGGERAVPIPPGLGQVGIQFEEFGLRLNYHVTSLKEVRGSITSTHEAKIDAEFEHSRLEPHGRDVLRQTSSGVLEAGKPLRLMLRREDEGMDHLVEVRVRKPR